MKRRTMLATLVTIGWIAAQGEGAPRMDLRDFMRVKLKHSQQSLEGLVLEDYAAVAKAAQEMSALSLEETWQVLTTSEYVEYSRKFRASADALSAAAKKHNLEESTSAFNQVTTRCVECHKYVRGVRMAKSVK
jgi:cytochrome c556